ncbi:MAG: hypothetical protein LBM19_04775, partial [Holosporales bacterium]|nr:hypothetical protein [Holosporales bacterium]
MKRKNKINIYAFIGIIYFAIGATLSAVRGTASNVALPLACEESGTTTIASFATSPDVRRIRDAETERIRREALETAERLVEITREMEERTR